MDSKVFKIKYYIGLGFGVLGVLDFLFLLITLNSVTNLGTVLPLVIGCFMIIYCALRLKGKDNLFCIKNRYFKVFLRVIIIAFALSFLLVEGLIFFSAREDRVGEVDYMIVLGAGLKGDKITTTFENRMKKSVEILNQNPDLKVIVSGGQGIGETVTEAFAMERYLMQNGISKGRIIKEERATSTMENFKFSKEILDKTYGDKIYRIIIITNDFHMFRAKILAKRNGFEPFGVPASTWWGTFPNNCIREYFAVVKSIIFDR